MNFIHKSGKYLAKASDGNPVVSVFVVFLFFLFFNLLESQIEILLFGDSFEHWLDILFIGMFIFYSGFSVVMCADYNTSKEKS